MEANGYLVSIGIPLARRRSSRIRPTACWPRWPIHCPVRVSAAGFGFGSSVSFSPYRADPHTLTSA